MNRQRGRWRMVRQAILALSLLVEMAFMVVVPVHAEVIFQESFDSHTDWNADSSLNSIECNPPACSLAPKGWEGFRAMPSRGAAAAQQSHDVPVISIQRPIGSLPDHSGSAKGKALVIYQASDLPDEPGVWKGDGQLAKVFPKEYPELYIRYWVKSQSGWRSVPGGALKTFRITHWPGSTASPNLFNQDHNHPTFYLDQSTWGGWAGAKAGFGAVFPAYRCSASPEDYFCARSGNKYQGQSYGDDYLLPPHGQPNRNYGDTSWHRYDIHIKVNTMGKKNGVVAVAYDGSVVFSHTDVVFLEPGSARKGFNALMLGGNSHNNFAANGNQWYAIDDVVVSTTPIPDNYAIRGGGASVAGGGQAGKD